MTARAGGAALRKKLRADRRQLTAKQRETADAAIVACIRNLSTFRAARHIALFFAFDGEPDLTPLIRFGQRHTFFAPIISRTDMAFAEIGPQTVLVPNFYGIPEPEAPELIDPRALDVVLTPLVAFDSRGTRVGVGAGYYDRCFSFLLNRRLWVKPKLIGCAYALQRVEPITANSWDVPLWGAVTENGFEKFQ